MSAVDTGSQALTEYREVSLQKLLASHEIVSFNEGSAALGVRPYIVVTEIPGQGHKLAEPSISTREGLRELGYTSMSPWTAWTREERIPELRDKQGIRKWYDMKRNDGTVRGGLNLIKTPPRAARWYVQPYAKKGQEPSAQDVMIADFVEQNLFEELNVDWDTLLDDVLLCLDYGYMPFEKVYKIEDGRTKLRKLAPRHPLDIASWEFDDAGGPAGIWMEPFVPYGNIAPPPNQSVSTPNMGEFIPIRKLAIFAFEPEAGDLRGISVLRSAYKHWFYKDTLYKIDAIQKERHGIGVPIIKLPPGYSEPDKTLADEMGRNLRTNDRAHIVAPANWEIMFMKLEGQPVSCVESIQHHNEQLLANILANFMGDPNAGEDSIDVFYKSTRHLAKTISNIFNKFVIKQLVDLNFNGVTKYPKLRARRIGEWNDLRTWTFALRNLVGSNAVIPDDPMEDFLRDELDLPRRDPTTSRIVETPQGAEGGDEPGDSNSPSAPKPSRVGPPRQNPKPPVRTPAGNAGRDSSGG